MSRLQLLLLRAAATTTLGAWLALMLRVPALAWTEQPLPFSRIYARPQVLGPFSETMLLLGLLLIGYLVMLWVAQSSEQDLPASIVLPVAVLSGLLATATYALFAEDVNFALAHVWSYVVAGLNPYSVPLEAVPRNPYLDFTGYDDLAYLYGPAWLMLGAGVMQAVGQSVLLFVGLTKLLQLGLLWLLGALAWHHARSVGSRRPYARAACILWNPLLLIDGVMTPHPDLPMAVALLAALLAWTRRREAAAVLLFALSVAVKFVTLLLVPALPLSLVAAGVFNGARRGRVLGAIVAIGLVALLLWPGVGQPFLQHGLSQELNEATNTALLPNLILALQAWGLLPGEQVLDRWELAESVRWFVFTPFWVGGSWLCVAVAVRRRSELPLPLNEPLALLLLGYHLLFTLVVLPWHFTTALCLCLLAQSRPAQLSGLLITVSGVLHYIADRWVWLALPADSPWIGWSLSLALLSGPLMGMLLLANELQERRPVTSPRLEPRVAASGY